MLLLKGVLMENLITNKKIIERAYAILENEYAFHKSTTRMNISFFDGVAKKDYRKLDNALKAIRQDFAKILVMMNRINVTYSSYQKGEYVSSYISAISDPATEELGCFIEYLFVKYRVILEYVQQILEICLPPQFDNSQLQKYEQLKLPHKKYKYLLEYVASNIQDEVNILNIKWFQRLRIERNYIIHQGATCLVYGDKEELQFNVMTPDALDKDEQENDWDTYFTNDKGLICYSHYWGLYISKLIVFVETILEFLLRIGKVSEKQEYMWEFFAAQGKGDFVSGDGTRYPDVQDVLTNLLNSLL